MKKSLLMVCIVLMLVSLVSCYHTRTVIIEVTPEPTMPIIEVTPDPHPFELPKDSFADYWMHERKYITVEETQVIITANIGMSEITILNKRDISITASAVPLQPVCMDITLSDNTGQIGFISLTESDYVEFLKLLAA